MKKALIFVVGFVLLSFTMYKVDFYDYAQLYDEVVIYTSENISYIDNAQVLKGQEFNRVVCNGSDVKTIAKSINKVAGVSFKTNEKNEEALLKKFQADYVSNTKIGEISITYGYNPRLREFVLVKGKKVNIQIANEKSVTVGYPLILGSY